MNNEYFAEMHKLIEKAKNYERMGREDEALKTYMEIHEKFFPNTSDLFERPAILLEKRKQFDEAIRICEKAIKLIGEGKITGVKDNFERRIQRIKSRSDYVGDLKNGKGKSRSEAPRERKNHFKLFRRSLKEVPAVKRDSTDRADKKQENHPVEAEKSIAIEKKVPRQVQETPHADFSKPEHIPEPITEPIREPIREPITEPTAVTKPSPVPVLEQVHLVEKTHVEDTIKKPKKRKALKWPTLHLRLPNLNDFKHMIGEIRNFKWSELKFFIFDFSEIKNGTFKFRKPTKSEWLALSLVITVILVLIFAIANKPKSQFEIAFDTSAFEWSQDITTDLSEENKKDLPPITPTMIDMAVKETQAMPGVRMAGVVVQKNVVGLIIMTQPGADRKQAKEAAEKMIRALASAAAMENKELSGPGPIGYGELFDYYALLVVAGENYDQLLIKGSKNPKVPGVNWRNEVK